MKFDREALREIFEKAELEIPDKGFLGQLCDLHTGSSKGMTDTIKSLENDLKDLERERDDLKVKSEDLEKSYKTVQGEFESFKSEQENKESEFVKDSVLKSYFESKNIKGGNLELAMLGSQKIREALELEDGKIKDTAELDKLVDGVFSVLVVESETKGAKTAQPFEGSKVTTKTKAEIMEIKDDKERRQQIAENPELFGLDIEE